MFNKNDEQLNKNYFDSEQMRQEAEFNAMIDIFKTENHNAASHDAKPSTNKTQKRHEIAQITKTEMFAMWLIVVLLVMVCSVTMQRSLIANNNDLLDRIGNLEYQVTSLMISNEVLAAKLDAYANAKQPIDITINVDGQEKDFEYDPESGELVEKPSNGGDKNENQEEIEFDTRPFFGVAFLPESEDGNHALGLKIDFVYNSSPAALSGILPGDILMSIDGTKIATFADLDAIISAHKANDVIKVQIATVSEEGIEVVELDVTLTYRGNFDFGEE
jgi:membrane-associated protease RseP (regulator of RpoE activity)